MEFAYKAREKTSPRVFASKSLAHYNGHWKKRLNSPGSQPGVLVRDIASSNLAWSTKVLIPASLKKRFNRILVAYWIKVLRNYKSKDALWNGNDTNRKA